MAEPVYGEAGPMTAQDTAGLVADLRLAERVFNEDAEDHAACLVGTIARRAADALEAMGRDLAEVRAENDRLRAALAQSDQPCVYCSLAKDEWAQCSSGFPGCDRADDAMGCPELGASMRATTAERLLSESQAEGRRKDERIKVLEEALGPLVERINEIEQVKAVAKFATEGTAAVKLSLLRDVRTALAARDEGDGR